MIREVLFWMLVGLVAYTYAGFPLLVFLRGKLMRRPYRQADETPFVTLIVAAYNEEASIAEKLENILALDYPREKLQVIVASDGSTDRTNEIVAQYAHHGIVLLPLPRVGKAAALNAAVAAATGEILVFSDANSLYAPDALRALVRPFADPQVGGVAGNQVYVTPGSVSPSGEGERKYWGFDRWLKFYESEAGNTISATGAIYAIRRHLFQPVPEGVTDDFITSVRVIAQGYRLVFAPDAVAYEPVAKTEKVEFGRKVRVITRGLRGVWMVRELLNPFRHGFYAVQLFSHKVLRRMVAFPLIALLLLSFSLWDAGLIYRAAAVAQAGLYASGLAGFLLRHTRVGGSKFLALPFFFCMVNAAVVVATFNLLRGQKIVLWETQRQVG